MAADGYLELFRAGGKQVEGEALDRDFAQAIAIDDFTMKTESTEKKKKKEKKKKGKDGKEGDSDDDKSGSKGKLKCPVTFKIGKSVDSSSPFLFKSYCTHTDQENAKDKPFKTARITLRKAYGDGALEYLVVEFEDVFVTDYNLKTDESKLPSESVSFNCKKACVIYRTQRLKGNSRATYGGWNFTEGQEGEWTP